jgi:hypothetical protein
VGGPVRFRGVTWVAVPRMLVARLVVGLIMVTGALVAVVTSIVQSFRNEPESWYFYPLLVLGLAVWLAFVALLDGAGVYVREVGVVVVNPLWVSSLRWDEIDRFSLDESPISARYFIGRVHRRGGGSTMLWGIRPFSDPYGKREAQEAIDFLNQVLASHVKSV